MSEQITHLEMLEALRRSGYLLERRLHKKMLKAGLRVESNVIFHNTEAEAGRELDLVAGNYATSRGCSLGPHYGDRLFFDLIVECKNNPQPAVFFETDYKPEISARIHWTGVPQKFHTWGILHSEQKKTKVVSLVDPLTILPLEKSHHYYRGSHAIQYCTFARKGDKDKGPWMAKHEDRQHEDFSKLAAATKWKLTEISTGRKNFWQVDKPSGLVWFSFVYPVLVLEGPMMLIPKGSLNPLATKHVRLFFSTLLHEQREDFIIDVVAASRSLWKFPSETSLVRT